MRFDVLAAHHGEHPRVQLEPFLPHERNVPAVGFSVAVHQDGIEPRGLQRRELTTPGVNVLDLGLHPGPVLGAASLLLERQRQRQHETARHDFQEFASVHHRPVRASRS